MIRLLLVATLALAGCATLDNDGPATICSIWSGRAPEGQEVEIEGYLYTNWRGFIAITSPECPQALLSLIDRESLEAERDHAWTTALSVKDDPSQAVRVRLRGRAVVGGDPAVNAISVVSYRDVTVVEKPVSLRPWR